MPLAAAGVGFTVTLGLLFTLWALMCYTALLLRLPGDYAGPADAAHSSGESPHAAG